MNKKYPIGTRIRMIRDYYILKGKTGTIKDITTTQYGVQFDEFKPGLHTLSGRCDAGFGYYVPNDVFEIIEIKETSEIVQDFQIY